MLPTTSLISLLAFASLSVFSAPIGEEIPVFMKPMPVYTRPSFKSMMSYVTPMTEESNSFLYIRLYIIYYIYIGLSI